MNFDSLFSKVTAQEKLLDATSDFENVLRTIEEQKKNEFVSQLSCEESGCTGKTKSYKGMKMHYSKKHKGVVIPDESIF